jgi:superfamily II DNA or RNA helicase
MKNCECLYLIFFVDEQIRGKIKGYLKVKLGSTVNLFSRILHYKTSRDVFSNENIKLYQIKLTKSDYSCYKLDFYIRKLSEQYDFPYKKRNSSGGTEFYYHDSHVNLSKFLDTLKVEHTINKIDVEDFVKSGGEYNEKLFEKEELLVNSTSMGDFKNILKIKELQKYLKLEQKNIVLRGWQKDAILRFYDFLKLFIKSGVIICPTGSGKTFLLMYISLLYSFAENKTVLILTKRKEIFRNLKYDMEKMLNELKKTDPKYLSFNPTIENMENAKDGNKIFTNLDKNKIIIGNLDKFISSNKYKKYKDYSFGTLGLVIHDENHWGGATKIYKFIKHIIGESDKLIGFSATPCRIARKNKIKTYKLYGNKDSMNVIYQRGGVDAERDGDIVNVLPRFFVIDKDKYVKTETNDGKTTKTCYDLNDDGYSSFFDHLSKTELQKSVYKKGIIWLRNTSEMSRFEKFHEKNINKYKEIEKISFLFSSYKNDKHGDIIDKFKQIKKNAILCVINRATEGFNDVYVDFGYKLYVTSKTDPLKEHQMMGRLSRAFGLKQHSRYYTMEYSLSDERKIELAKRFGDWLSYVASFETIGSSGMNKIKNKNNVILDLANRFFTFDKDEENGIGEMEFKSLIIQYSGFSKKEIYKIMQQFNKENKISHKIMYLEKSKKGILLKKPEEYFGELWINWYDFLNIDTSEFIKDKQTWKKRCIELNIKDYSDYLKKTNKHKELPNMPEEFYYGFTNFEEEIGIDEDFIY